MTSLRVRYQTIEIGDCDIHLKTLRDKQQFLDDEGEAEKVGINSTEWPIFGVVWPSSIILAKFLDTYNVKKLRILEVGCGIGLSSLMLNGRNADISSTDYHPEAGNFLAENTKLNEGREIPFFLANWADESDKLGTFDLIVGSDLLYEDQHIKTLSRFINHHAKPTSAVILVDPGRGRKTKFSNAMSEFGFTFHHEKINKTADSDYTGYILHFIRTQQEKTSEYE